MILLGQFQEICFLESNNSKQSKNELWEGFVKPKLIVYGN